MASDPKGLPGLFIYEIFSGATVQEDSLFDHCSCRVYWNAKTHGIQSPNVHCASASSPRPGCWFWAFQKSSSPSSVPSITLSLSSLLRRARAIFKSSIE